jgi:hypothetical protein
MKLRGVGAEKDLPNLAPLLTTVADKAPRIVDKDYGGALYWIATLPWVRPLEAWEPRGKGRETIFRSLVEHLLAKFRTPPFLWDAFFAENASTTLVPVVARVAAGGSLADEVKSGALPVPLTRKMCHDLLLTTAEYRILEAIRRVEVRAHKGDPRLFRAWMGTEAGRTLHSAEDEAFWLTVLAWFSANPMLDPEKVAPLVDYIGYRRRQEAGFSMKGRTPLALMRGMDEWHGDLAKAKAISGTIFRPSGFKPGEFDRSRRTATGNFQAEVWKVEEILTSKALAAEGRAMSHCVFSYAWSIEKGSTSIWSMTLDEGMGPERTLTIEVRNDLRRIVQARGKCNKAATSRDHTILVAWAGMNNLEISLGRW